MEVREPVVEYLAKKKDMNYWDYCLLPDDRNRYEVLNGELAMTPAPTTYHQNISKIIEIEFLQLERDKKTGKVFDAPIDVVLDENIVVQPDLIFILNENITIITEKNIQGAPDLIIEILSPATAYNDLFEKKEIYQKYGVKEYWIVDPKGKWIEIFTLSEGKYKSFAKAEKQGMISSKLLKEFSVDLEQVFEEIK